MAIKEFIIGPQYYIEEGYFSGDYWLTNVSHGYLTCEADLTKGLEIITGPYYLDNYIDGTYYHNNSMAFTMEVDAMIVQVATVNLQGYYQEGYYQSNYFGYQGGNFTLTCEAERLVSGVTVEASGSFSSSITQSTNISVIRTGIVSLSSQFESTATISHIEGADLFAFGEAALAVEVSRIRDNNISASSAFTIAVDASRTRTYSSEEDAAFTVSIDNLRVRFNQAAIDAAFSLASNIAITRPGSASLNSNSNLTATISHIQGIDIVAFTNASLSATGVITKSTAVSVSSLATLESTVERTRDNASAISSNSSLSSTISKTVQGSIVCEALFSPSIVCNAITNTFAVLDSTTSLTADNTRSRDTSAGLAVIVLSQFDISIVRNAVIDISSNSSLSNTVNRIQRGNIQCESLFTPSINCVVTVNSFANLETNITVVANNSRTRSFDINASSSFSIAVDADKIASANIEIFSESALSSIVSKIAGITADIVTQADLNSIVYIIKQFSIEEASAFSPSISCNVTVNPFANLESAFSFNINLSKTITFNVDANAQSSLTVNTNVISSNSSTMVSQSSLTALGIRSVRFITTNVQGQIISPTGNILQTDLYPNYSQVTLAQPE